jgi:ABC-type Fe3+/spermidine/putrescine transport system ATPase subunit
VDVYALNGVNLTVREGEFVCPLGPSALYRERGEEGSA